MKLGERSVIWTPKIHFLDIGFRSVETTLEAKVLVTWKRRSGAARQPAIRRALSFYSRKESKPNGCFFKLDFYTHRKLQESNADFAGMGQILQHGGAKNALVFRLSPILNHGSVD
jgi:hypothetical protein